MNIIHSAMIASVNDVHVRSHGLIVVTRGENGLRDLGTPAQTTTHARSHHTSELRS